MTKKPSPRNKAWEKDRRDRLNQTFNDLAKLLPDHDPKSPFSKIEILQKSVALIDELNRKLKALNTEQAMIDKFAELDGKLKILKIRNGQLLEILQGAEIAVPPYKSLLIRENISDPQILIEAENDENKQAENIQSSKKPICFKKTPEKPKRKYKKRNKKTEENHPVEASPLAIPRRSAPKKPAVTKVKRIPLLRITKATGGMKRVTVKSEIYKLIQKHVLKCNRKELRRKSKSSQFAVIATSVPEVNATETSKPDEIGKPVDINEILPNPLSNSDLSNDLFVSLDVPVVHHAGGSLSPTEAFLMSFPVVSGSGSVSVGKGNDQSLAEGGGGGVIRVSEPLNSIGLGLDNLFSSKEDFQVNYRSEGKQSCTSEVQKVTGYSLEHIMHGHDNPNNDMGHQKPLPEIQPSYSNNQLGLPLLESNFTMADKPSFNPPSMCPVESIVGNHHHPTDQHPAIVSLEKAAPLQNPQIDGLFLNRNQSITDANFSLSTDTKTTNSWSYNIKTICDKDQHQSSTNVYYVNPPGIEESINYVNSQPFTFSLTKTTDTPKRNVNSKSNAVLPQTSVHGGGLFGYTTASQATNSIIFDSYNPSFSLGPNTFLSPRPPPPVGVLPPTGSTLSDCHQYGSKPFSFQLTSATETPTTNTSKQNQFNSFPVATTLDTPSKATKSRRQPVGDGQSIYGSRSLEAGRKGSKLPADGARPRDKQDHRKSAAAEKKKGQSEEISNKSHVNWMTDSTTNSQAPEFCYPMLQNTNLSMPYLPPPPPPSTNSMMGHTGSPGIRMDLNHKSDIFFAHPPEEENFLWNKNSAPAHSLDPSTVRYRHDDFNVSQLLPPPPFVPAPPPTAPLARQNAPQIKTTTAPNQWRANTISGSSDYQPNGNYFSVSNLVVNSSKKYPPTKVVEPPPPVTMNSTGHNKWNRSGSSSSNNKIYSAEALIGNSSSSYSSNVQAQCINVTNKRYPIGNALNNSSDNLSHFNDIPPPMETEISDYNNVNYNVTGSSQNQFSGNIGGRIDHKLSNSQMMPQETTTTFPFYSNDFIQPLFTAPPPPPPSLHLVPDGQTGTGPMNGTAPEKVSSSNKLNEYKRKYYEEDVRNDMNSGQDLYAPPVPQATPSSSSSGRQHQLHPRKFSNYDISSSTNFFPGHPPPLIINHCGDTFANYSNSSKMPQSYVTAPPPIDFNSNLTGSTGTYSTNSLTNFNLSSICPEINSPIH